MMIWGTEQAPGLDLCAPVLERLKIATHVAHTRDAVGDEQWQHHPLVGRQPIAEDGMHVHVPQAGNQEFTVGVDEGCAARRREITTFSEVDDAAARHHHRHVAASRCTRRIDDGDVSESKCGHRVFAGNGKAGHEE